ncbi:N-acetylmuramoyl-L-alanine amidase [Steroidobacter denitrificans]|uniref:N-acetylmuramoyl-L-alanine amidase n=1 Tax=Steroidobacter denitrificans TaxID=465721 RepID=UPI000B2ED1E1|nr:N-acetylmuramoyl-L-alanine amidase [Steroidobacter denitrificans]
MTTLSIVLVTVSGLDQVRAQVPASAARATFEQPVTIQDLRLWAGPQATRLVFDLSAPARYSVMTLRNPDRVVVDLASARLAGSRLPEGQGFVRRLRIGEQTGGALRVVIDLTGPAKPNSFAVAPDGPYGHRLVVDLAAAAGHAAPLSAASAAPGQAPAARTSTPKTPAPPTIVKSTRDTPGRDIVIAIDAGHGGVDPGSIGKRGTHEKHVTLAIARRLKERIDRELGMRAVLTRDGDHFIGLRERIVRARRQQADMFVSVHADAYHDRSVAGSSVYVLSARGASDESARWLADRENAADLLGGVSLDDKDSVLASVLLDLSQGASMSASIKAADLVMDELYGIGNVTRRGVKHAGFLVLKSPDIPSILVETAFISNPAEEARLLDPKHQRRLAEAIHAGVRAYFHANPPPDSLIAQRRMQGGSSVIARAGARGSEPAAALH